jgi:transposase-like protein
MAFGDHQATGLSGTIEADETYIGGRESNKHASKKIKGASGGVGKVIVQGVIERGQNGRKSRVSTKIINKTDAATLETTIREIVMPGSNVCTDAHPSYRGLSYEFMHEFVDHAVEYVRDNVHTNGLENFFSLLKRMVKGTYVAVAPEHLEAYLSEQVFRFNERHDDDGGRFRKLVKGVHGKRLTYKQLYRRLRALLSLNVGLNDAWNEDCLLAVESFPAIRP